MDFNIVRKPDILKMAQKTNKNIALINAFQNLNNEDALSFTSQNYKSIQNKRVSIYHTLKKLGFKTKTHIIKNNSEFTLYVYKKVVNSKTETTTRL